MKAFICNMIFVLVNFVLLINFSLAGTVEEQRKYLFVKINPATLDFIENGGDIGSLKSFKHSDYIYSDIYLDTADFELYRNRLSLRFRKRAFGNGKFSYGLQLKSEMDNTDGLRMEVEEKELDRYQVLLNGQMVPLVKILDTFFNIADSDGKYNRKEIDHASKILSQWFQFKYDAPIDPFMKLKHIFPKDGSKMISHFKVALVGKSKRIRSHIFSVKDETEVLPFKNFVQNQVALNKLPLYFVKNPKSNWFLETSFDKAVFYPLMVSKKQLHTIVEYEVENKYFDFSKSKQIIDIFEKELFARFDVMSGRDSKSRVSLKYFYF